MGIMTAHRWDTVTTAAFMLAYLGVMGLLLDWTVPLMAPWRDTIALYCLAPLTGLGTLGVVLSHWLRPED